MDCADRTAPLRSMTMRSPGAPRSPGLSRRELLARTGVLGAAVALSSTVGGRLARAQAPVGDLLEDGTDALAPPLREVVRDTFAGIAAFVCPGPDRFSVQQGETDDAPGGVDADGGGFLAHALDHYLPYPDAFVRPFVQGLRTASAGGGAEPVGDLLDVADEVARAIDDAVLAVLANDATVPASLPAAMVLNLATTVADPATLAGPFPASPFANGTMAQKAAAFRVLDEDVAGIVALVDADLDEPGRAAISGLVRFLSASLVHFTAFGIYSEWSTSRGRGDVVARPVGWDLANFTPGEMVPADGWDELRGYWKGRRQADDVREWPRHA